jgi:hypothetical protein
MADSMLAEVFPEHCLLHHCTWIKADWLNRRHSWHLFQQEVMSRPIVSRVGHLARAFHFIVVNLGSRP